jgi:hypothetical protein
MQIQRRTFLAMAAVCLSGIRAHAAEDIVGVWSSEMANSQNNHVQLVITPTEVTLIVGMLTESRYQIEGNTIAFGPVPLPGQPVQQRLTPVPFSIDGAALTITRTPGHPIILTRVDEFRPEVHPIVGAWIYQHPVGVPAVLRFTPSGALQTMLKLSSDHGPYRIENDMLTIKFGSGTIAVRIKREGNVLIATGGDGRPDRFVKSE